MLEPARRAEGLLAGCCAMAINRRAIDPAHELPGRRLPMWVLPPPKRTLAGRVLNAIGSLGSTIVAGWGLMALAQYLTTPG